MKKISLLLLAIGLYFNTQAQKVVGYVPQYRTTTWMDTYVEWDKMTDIYYFGSVPTSTGGITIEQATRFDHVKQKAVDNNRNVWLSVGGWLKSANFISVANNSTYRQAFADEALRLCQVHGLTGVDIDWEFPSYGQEAAFTAFFKTLYETLHPAGYLVSAAAGGEATHADKWAAETFDYIDDLNIMSYDAPSGNHASLQFMKDAMDLYNAQGCPYSKMLGGAAFYSRTSVKMYNEILNAATDKQTAYETDGTGSVLYNGKNTLEAKMDYVVGTKGGLGILVWEVTQDVKGQYSLLNVLYNKAQDYACPVSKPDLGNDVSICGSSSLTLDANVSGSYTYSWKKDGSTISGSSSTLSVSSAGVYEVTVSDGSCSYSDEIEVLGVISPADLGADVDLCSPSIATLDAGVSGGGMNYLWKKDNATISGETSQTLDVSKAGTYKVIVSATGCSSVNDEIIVTSSLVDVDDETFCNGNKATFTVNNPGSFDYKWYTALTGGTALTTANSYTTPNLTSTTDYYVEKDDPTGGICNGVAAWSSTTTYQAGPGADLVTYNGKLYESFDWYTLNNNPETDPGNWTEIGTCGSACDRTKVTAILDAGCTVTPTVSVVADKNNVCENETITFTATVADAGTNPTLVWKVNNVQKQSSTSLTYSSSTLNNSDKVEVSLASDGTVKDEVTMILQSAVTPSLSIVGDANNVCSGTDVTFTGTPTNGGTPTYKWYVGTAVQTATSGSFTYAPSNGDVVKVEMTTSLTCVTGSTATSNEVTMVVNPSVTPTVSISEDANNVCSGTAVTFTATPTNGGTSPVYDWKLNNVSTGETSGTYTSTSLVDGDKVTAVLTSSETCVSGTATSNEVTININSSVAPTASITADKSTICPNETVNFTSTITNGGTTPVYDWKLNNVSTGVTTSTYSNSTLNNNDKVKLVLTSSAACSSTPTVTSNEETISVGSAVTPSVSISEDANNVCSGTDVTFTATPTNSGTPTYKWYIGTAVQSETSGSFTYAPSNGDVVKVEMTTSLTCVTGSTASSNEVTMVVNPSVTPSVSIVEDANSVCSGTTVTFTATPTNGGTSPVYDWKLNNVSTGETSATYSSTSLADGDKVTVVLTSSEVCVSGTATSNEVTMNINSSVAPTASITADKSTICPNETVNFTSTITNGGTTPVYDWKLNNVSTGVTTSTYSNSTLNNNDKVKLVLTSSAACSSTSTVTSNEETISVGSAVTPSVSIVEDANNVCSGTDVTFTATPTNGGTPTYKWYVGTAVQTSTSGTFTYAPSNGDVVKVEMTTSLTCVTGSTATSNEVTMVVNSSVTPSVSMSEDANNVCSGTDVTFTATPTNGGTPTYKWYVGTAVQTSTSGSFTYSPSNGDVVEVEMTTSLSCPSTAVATSNSVTMVVKSTVTNVQGIANQDLQEGFSPYQIDLSTAFSGTGITYSASNSSKVALSISGGTATVSELSTGSEVVTITATDGCGLTAQTTIQFNVTPVGIINPDVTVNEPTSTSITLVEGDLLSVDFDAIAQQGSLQSVTAQIKDAVTGQVVSDVTLTNSGNNYSGSWTAVEGNYNLVITVPDSQGGLTTKTISVTVTAQTVTTSLVISSLTNGELVQDPGDMEIISAISGLNGKSVSLIKFIIKDVKTGISTFYDGDVSTMSMTWYPTVNATYIVRAIATLDDNSTFTSNDVLFTIDLTTGVNTIEGVTEITAYPNPMNDYVAVQIEAIQSQHTEVSVYNVLGAKLATEQVGISSGSNLVEFDTSLWDSGLYIIMIKSSSGVHSIKVEK